VVEASIWTAHGGAVSAGTSIDCVLVMEYERSVNGSRVMRVVLRGHAVLWGHLWALSGHASIHKS